MGPRSHQHGENVDGPSGAFRRPQHYATTAKGEERPFPDQSPPAGLAAAIESVGPEMAPTEASAQA